jgi:lipocalin
MKVELILSTIFICSHAIMNSSPIRPTLTYPGCPSTLQLMPDFKFSSFAGVWYEAFKYSSQFERGKCISMNITLPEKSKPTKVGIILSQKLNGKKRFSEFEQNATMTNISSVWSFYNNDSLTSESDSE